MRIQEGTCLDVTIEVDGRIIDRGEEEWLYVFCFTHGWDCGHRHTRWGPVLRCIARHVASQVEEDQSDEVDGPGGSESEQVTSESPSAGS